MRTLEELRTFFASDRFAMELCGITIDAVEADGARLSMPLTPAHMNAGGVAQGGAVYTLMDTAFAVASNLEEGLTVSQSATIHYLRPGTGERLYARAALLSAGRTTCLYRVEVTNERGDLVAYGTESGFRKTPSVKMA